MCGRSKKEVKPPKKRYAFTPIVHFVPGLMVGRTRGSCGGGTKGATPEALALHSTHFTNKRHSDLPRPTPELEGVECAYVELW